VVDLDRQLAELDELIASQFRSHPHAEVITSIVGLGDLLGAELLGATADSLVVEPILDSVRPVEVPGRVCAGVASKVINPPRPVREGSPEVGTQPESRQ
jgi:hypothetical protein